VLTKSLVPPDSQISAWILGGRRLWIASAAVTLTVLSAAISLAPSVLADPSASFKSAVVQARAGTSCGPLRYNPVVEQVAEISNRSTDNYLIHNLATSPVDDPLPGLKDLGYGGSKAALLRGAAKNEADAIRGALLEGFDKFPDCSYTDFGVSMLRNQSTGYYLSSLILARP
jgi:hypothetical protein